MLPAETSPNLINHYSDAQLRKIFVIDHIYDHIRKLYAGEYNVPAERIDSYVRLLQDEALGIEAIDPNDAEAMRPVDLKFRALMNETQ
jgi:hypothetical protein